VAHRVGGGNSNHKKNGGLVQKKRDNRARGPPCQASFAPCKRGARIGGKMSGGKKRPKKKPFGTTYNHSWKVGLWSLLKDTKRSFVKAGKKDSHKKAGWCKKEETSKG